jgi:hypothetical protein
MELELMRDRFQSPQAIPATLYHVNWIDPQSGPAFLEFRFIYRSREVLISKGILPSPTPAIENKSLESSQGKKRKLKSDQTPKRKYKKKNDGQSTSPFTTVNIASSTPPKKSHRSKNSILANSPTYLTKKESNSRFIKEQSPITPPDSDLRATPLVPTIQRRSPSHPIPSTILPWVESQSANIELPIEVLRELRDLRVPPTSLHEIDFRMK